MGNPALARNDGDGDRFYLWRGEAFWSVTTLIGGGVPKHLTAWAAKSVADLVYDGLTSHGPHSRSGAIIRRWTKAGRGEVAARQAAGFLTSIRADKLTDEDYALRWLKGTPERIRDAAANLGSAVHDEAERLVLQLARETGEAWSEGRDMPDWPDELLGHMRSFVNFLDDWRPVYLATEATVFNRPQAYAGTLDAIMELHIGGRSVPVLVDYKSGRNTYPEVGLQLAAYSRAEFVGLPDGETEVPIPATEQGAVLHIRPGPTPAAPRGYTFRPVRIDDEVYRSFLHAREVYRWAKEIARTVFLDELAPEPFEAIA